MRRLFWLAMGITIGVLVVRKLSAPPRSMTPGSIGRSIADGLGDLADAIGEFGADIRAAAAEREAELRAGTGLDAPLPAGDAGPAARPARRPLRLSGRPPDPRPARLSRQLRAGPAEPSRYMQTAEIRRRFLEHFAQRGHTVVPSASLVSPDPSLLFTVAGMVPFIPYLTGREPAPYPRATSVQKCVRTLDIEEVGKTTRHGTFFQMNGNFSFGDYFKEGAIQHAWELITGAVEDGGLGFDPEKIWATVYLDDDEAADAWHRIAGLPKERIQRLGKKDNYWHTGAPGPAGPCSEIYVDRGPEFGPDGGPAVDTAGDRFLEIWNLVFMQYEIDEVRSKEEFRDPRRAAEEEHRHRHGPGAGRLPAAGRRQHVRDRRGRPGPAPRRRARRRHLRPRPRGRRPAARRRRPRPQRR